MTSKYATNVDNMAHRVPIGIALDGFRRSPDMEAPAKMPDVAGKRTPKRSRKVPRPPNSLPAECGKRLDLRVAKLTPVKLMPRTGSWNAGNTKAESGMLAIDTVKMTRRALLAFAKTELPARQRRVQTSRAAVSNRYSHQ